jgi:hypothetical protein
VLQLAVEKINSLDTKSLKGLLYGFKYLPKNYNKIAYKAILSKVIEKAKDERIYLNMIPTNVMSKEEI